MGYIAKVNFDAGKGLAFNKGAIVTVSDEAITSRLLSEGLIVALPAEAVEPKEVVKAEEAPKEEKLPKKKKG